MKINIGDTIVTANGERFECMTREQIQLLNGRLAHHYSDAYHWGYDRNDGVFLSWDYNGTPTNGRECYYINDVISNGKSIAPDKRKGRPLDLCQYRSFDGKWNNFLDEKHYQATKEDKETIWPIRYLSVDA